MANDNANVVVLRPGIVCTKELQAEYADGTMIPSGGGYSGTVGIDGQDPDYTNGTWFPITIRYHWEVENTGDVPLD